jgi:hypothetical protein
LGARGRGPQLAALRAKARPLKRLTDTVGSLLTVVVAFSSSTVGFLHWTL